MPLGVYSAAALPDGYERLFGSWINTITGICY